MRRWLLPVSRFPTRWFAEDKLQIQKKESDFHSENFETFRENLHFDVMFMSFLSSKDLFIDDPELLNDQLFMFYEHVECKLGITL